MPNNFATVGKTLGENQNYSLNLDSKKNKDFGYSISYNPYYTYIDYFYITDHDKSYNITGKILDVGFYYDDYTLTLSLKQEAYLSADSSQKWGQYLLKKFFNYQ